MDTVPVLNGLWIALLATSAALLTLAYLLTVSGQVARPVRFAGVLLGLAAVTHLQPPLGLAMMLVLCLLILAQFPISPRACQRDMLGAAKETGGSP